MEIEENASDLTFPLTNKSWQIPNFKSRNMQNNGKTHVFPG